MVGKESDRGALVVGFGAGFGAGAAFDRFEFGAGRDAGDVAGSFRGDGEFLLGDEFEFGCDFDQRGANFDFAGVGRFASAAGLDTKHGSFVVRSGGEGDGGAFFDFGFAGGAVATSDPRATHDAGAGDGDSQCLGVGRCCERQRCAEEKCGRRDDQRCDGEGDRRRVMWGSLARLPALVRFDLRRS